MHPGYPHPPAVEPKRPARQPAEPAQRAVPAASWRTSEFPSETFLRSRLPTIMHRARGRNEIRQLGTDRSGTQPLGIVSFLLTPQETRRRIPATFPHRFRFRGPGRKRVRVVPEGGETCSICRVGLCSALIRNAWPAATGCVPAIPEANFAATVTHHSATYRRRWALA